MVEDVLIDARLAEGQLLVQGMLRGGVAVVVAGWVMNPDREWTLYISATYPDPSGWGDAFRVLHSCYMGFDQPTFGLSEVSLVRTKDVVTDELLAIRSRGRPGRIARARVDRIDGRPARLVYVFPPTGPLSPIDVVRTVDELVTGVSRATTLAVTFRDGRRLVAAPVGTSLNFVGDTTEATVTLRHLDDGKPHSYPATDIADVSLPDPAA